MCKEGVGVDGWCREVILKSRSLTLFLKVRGLSNLLICLKEI